MAAESMSPYRAPGEVQLEAVDLDAVHGRILPWRGIQAPCAACGAKQAGPDGTRPPTYDAAGGSVDGRPCQTATKRTYVRRWWSLWIWPHEVETLCGDSRPHVHVKCRLCDVRFKMAPVPPA